MSTLAAFLIAYRDRSRAVLHTFLDEHLVSLWGLSVPKLFLLSKVNVCCYTMVLPSLVFLLHFTLSSIQLHHLSPNHLYLQYTFNYSVSCVSYQLHISVFASVLSTRPKELMWRLQPQVEADPWQAMVLSTYPCFHQAHLLFRVITDMHEFIYMAEFVSCLKI